mgnify:CR=1 FL=1
MAGAFQDGTFPQTPDDDRDELPWSQWHYDDGWGYIRASFANRSAFHWEFLLTSDKNGTQQPNDEPKLMDELWIIKQQQ